METLRRKPSPIAPRERKGNKKHTVKDLLGLMARLRRPSGCPWDRQQTENTLKKYLIEEAYEALEAIEVGSREELKEELGDLLLQIIFLCRVYEEKGHFSFSDVVHTLAEKLIRRHPHVFPPSKRDESRAKPRDAQEVVEIWRGLKELEEKNTGKAYLLDGIPLSLPALERAQRISERVSRAGFDWPSIGGVWKKAQEEMAEIKKAEVNSPSEAVAEEFGDLLFTLVNWARFKEISAEDALRKANRRFIQRFQEVEAELRRRGRTPEESTLKEMDQIWNETKKRKA
ncbi:MAG: nucleoside triphosphate pyrophosphohydrolase [Deltaproteobacteria bacterium]|nr:nucleoside triphosphate pyrophosphohydrolase [Deltaproteobacteria bacterium]